MALSAGLLPTEAGGGGAVTREVHRGTMKNNMLQALQRLAAPNAGYIVSYDAARAGVDESALWRARRAGLLMPVRRSVGRLAAAPVHPHEAVHAAALALPGRM